MNKSESIKNLAKALAKFQGEVKDPRKEASNPFFKSKYVTLDALVDAIRPAMTANGLSYIQSPSGDGEHISVTTLLMHESGEWIEADPFVMKVSKIDPQGAGSAVTYGRRYSLQAVLGVTWCEKDDDGNATMIISREQAMELVNKAKKVFGENASMKVAEFLSFYGYKKTTEIQVKDYAAILGLMG